ncbi:type I toxin-antitoxin system Fst family toxin [Enterococcus sp. AZ192]
MENLLTLIVAPLFVALVTILVDHWLSGRDDD